ncbi:hypothetical protein DPMN_174185 [Dreissena polymorpha]|jgi:hypothetical protein|uniref:Uncharacterized protein n=1 Tax=Dreissena polymorpha TaxID=45954 RepID=A0A9D4E4A2_DREPO|nr:hypothetical protein DPMN_174179 [Dreissena polymorpha]KAH3772838.1 hypothetical protein DPMN_174185 [Dreissena polymorpha]
MAHTKRRSITYLAAGGCENNPLLVLRVKLGHSFETLARALQKLLEREFARALDLNTSLLHALTLPSDSQFPNTGITQNHGESTIMESLRAQAHTR